MLSLLFILNNFQVALGISPVSALVYYLCAMVQKLMPTLPISPSYFLKGGWTSCLYLGRPNNDNLRIFRNVESIQTKVVLFMVALHDAT